MFKHFEAFSYCLYLFRTTPDLLLFIGRVQLIMNLSLIYSINWKESSKKQALMI